MKLSSRLIVVFLLVFSFSCSRDQSLDNPCSEIIAEKPPERRRLKFIDKLTGNQLLVEDELLPEDISIKNIEEKMEHC